MKKLLPIVLALSLMGCHAVPTKVNDPSSTLLLPITQAQVDLAKKDFPAVATDLANATTAVKSVAAQDVKYQQQLQKDEQFIAAHNDDIWGARTHRIWKWILFLGFPLVAILGAILTYAGGLPAFAHIVLSVLSGGIHAVHLGILWVVSKFRKAQPAKAG